MSLVKHFKRNVFILITLLLTFLVVGCGGPSSKEEAQRIDKEYYQSTKKIYSDYEKTLAELREKYNDAEELDVEFAQIIDSKYISEISKLKEKLQSENLSSDLENQKLSLLTLIDSFNDLFKHMALLKDKTKINHENFMTDLEFIYTNIFDNKLKYENESSKIIFGKGTYELNLNNFKKIHKGDSYLRVASLFKMPGQLTNSNESNTALIGHRKLEHYYWEDNGALVRIMFENDKVYMLEQRGLK